MEARWGAGHRGEELGQPPTERQREGTDREREGGVDLDLFQTHAEESG